VKSFNKIVYLCISKNLFRILSHQDKIKLQNMLIVHLTKMWCRE